jgi:hypothetical protein
VSLRLSELWDLDSGCWQYVLETGRFWGRRPIVRAEPREQFAMRCRETLGVGIGDIERVTIVWPSAEHPDLRDVPPEVRSTVFIYTLKRPGRHPKPSSGALHQHSRQYRGHTIWTDTDGWTAFQEVDERTFLIGSRSSLEWIIDAAETRGRSKMFADAVAAAGKPGLAVFACHPAFLRKAIAGWGEEWLPLTRALEPARGVWGSLSWDRGPRLDIRVTFATSAAADLSCAVVNAAFPRAAEALQPDRFVRYQYAWGRDGPPEGSESERQQRGAKVQLWEAVRDARTQSDGPTLRTTLSASSHFLIGIPGSHIGYTLPVLWGDLWYRESVEHNTCVIAEALQQYHRDHGHFPPPAVYGKDGKAFLSWRVLLLPYLGDAKLFREFHPDEPWDSPHNRPLAERMPWVYCDWYPSPYRPRPYTGYQVFVGKGSVFEGPRGTAKREISGGLENTILAIQSDRLVLWTKPEELPFTPQGERSWPKINTAILADGTVSGGLENPNGGGPLGFEVPTLREGAKRTCKERTPLEKAEEQRSTGYIGPQRIIP